VKAMDNTIINLWNRVVQKDDTVYILGDFSMRSADYKPWYEKTLSGLEGRKVLILGNHDRMRPCDYLEVGFESVHTSLIVDGIFLAHDPALANALPSGMRMFCGHVHELFEKLVSKTHRVLNVGVDVCGFQPISWDLAKEKIEL
jgi:calcineurin-like phosphoesterase family protein